MDSITPMATYTLFGADDSGSAAIELALTRAGAAYRLVNAATWEPGEGLEALQAVNPLGQIPTLQLPGGEVLTESAAILIHLGLAFPESGLLPSAPTQRAQAIRGLVFIAANCYSAIGVIDYPERWLSTEQTATGETATESTACDALRRGATLRLHQHWSIFADQFAASPFLSGDAPGALDFLAAVVSKWSGARAHLRAARPAFHATLERIERDPQAGAVFKRHWPDSV